MKKYYYHITVFTEDTSDPKHYFLSSGVHCTTSNNSPNAQKEYNDFILRNEVPKDLLDKMNPETCQGAGATSRISWFKYKFFSKSYKSHMTIKEAREIARCT